MKPTFPIKLPRLYIFLIVVAVLFTVFNVAMFYYGKSIALYMSYIWQETSIILLSLVGSLLIGMYISYRMLALRTFTPFEREMMEMRLEVTELKGTLDELKGRLEGAMASNPGEEASDAEGEGPERAEEEGPEEPETSD